MKRYITHSEYPLLRGMELIIHRVHPKNGEGEELAHTLFECEVKWHQLSDFLHFEVFPLYLKEVSGALGAWRFLYHPVLYVERATTDYWILPIAGWILFWRSVRKAWMLPARFFYEKGYLQVDPGGSVPLLWFVRLRFRRQARPDS